MAEHGRRLVRQVGSTHERQADAIADQVIRAGPSTLQVGRSPGSLPRELAHHLSAATGFDFTSLRIHVDGQSRRSAQALGARAYTTGRDVYLAGEPTDAADLATLAHEAVHAAQQGALPGQGIWGRAPAAIERSQPNVPQLKPGEDADDSWRSLVKQESSIPDDPAIRTRGSVAKSRFLQATEGKRLINNLFNVSTQGGTTPRFDLDVTYRTDLPPETDGLHASGWFQPRSRDAKHYKVHVRDVLPPQYGSRRLPGAKTGEGVWFSHTDPESDMSATLHHELEHVEFMRTRTGLKWETGHGDVEKGEVEESFRERIAAFEGDLDGIEDRIHKDEQEANKPAASAPTPDLDASPAKPAAIPSPSFAGLRLSGAGGIGSHGGARFTGVAGADIVLGRISSLNLGVRGIYLTPDRLLAGGTIGYRSVQSGESRPGERVENPLFFDIEAGVVGQLNSTERSKVLNRAAFYGSAGVGQEYGTAGTRFFWRVGGYVIVSDRKEAFGGGTVGVGLHFQ